ncbi:MAG: hypothetical protein ACR2QV_13310 [Gammaproteobacteria bacterium]
MESHGSVPDQQLMLEASDRVARAAFLWIRHADAVDHPAPGAMARQDLVAGVIFGLCDALRLDDKHALLSAYAFFLIDGQAAKAFDIARSMFSGRNSPGSRVAYRRGRDIARDLVGLLEAPDPGADTRLPI